MSSVYTLGMPMSAVELLSVEKKLTASLCQTLCISVTQKMKGTVKC